MIDRASLRMSAALLLAGQVLYIVVTQFHAGGPANDHPAIFAVYAGSGIWKAVHVGQFACAAILLAGLVALPFAVNAQAGSARWLGRFGAALAVVALALYGVLQAVDGVGNQEVDEAWVNAPNTEKAARFASAEAMRWLEWGARSYHDYALGLALLLIAAAILGTTGFPRPIAYLMGRSRSSCRSGHERATGPGLMSADRRRTDHCDSELVPVEYDDAAIWGMAMEPDADDRDGWTN